MAASFGSLPASESFDSPLPVHRASSVPMLMGQRLVSCFAPEHIRGNRYTWKVEGSPPQPPCRPEAGKVFRLLSRTGYGVKGWQHKLNIHRVHHLTEMYALYAQDIFHTLVNMRLRYLLSLFAMAYIMAFSCLALMFWALNERCALGMETPLEAFAFSVETWLTIGYGVPARAGPYFRRCASAVAVLTLQGIVGLVMNAILVGIVITHTSSGARRGCTLMFSERAVIREAGGRLYLMMQVCEMRSTQLLEAHVRAYVVRRPISPSEVPVDAPQAFELRLLRPDDETGALLLPVLPSVIVHEIDQCSPLAPATPDDPMKSRHWARPLLRAADASNGGRDSVWCRTCGEQFAAREMLDAHIRYQAEQDALNGAKLHPHRAPLAEQKPSKRSAREGAEPLRPDVLGLGLAPEPGSWRREVAAFLGREWFEILCILEGVDGTTAATVQARHSYVAEDIAWDHTFAPMFSVDRARGAVIDFTKIHDLVDAPPQP